MAAEGDGRHTVGVYPTTKERNDVARYAALGQSIRERETLNGRSSLHLGLHSGLRLLYIYICTLDYTASSKCAITACAAFFPFFRPRSRLTFSYLSFPLFELRPRSGLQSSQSVYNDPCYPKIELLFRHNAPPAGPGEGRGERASLEV